MCHYQFCQVLAQQPKCSLQMWAWESGPWIPLPGDSSRFPTIKHFWDQNQLQLMYSIPGQAFVQGSSQHLASSPSSKNLQSIVQCLHVFDINKICNFMGYKKQNILYRPKITKGVQTKNLLAYNLQIIVHNLLTHHIINISKLVPIKPSKIHLAAVMLSSHGADGDDWLIELLTCHRPVPWLVI